MTVCGVSCDAFRIVYAENPEEIFKGKNPRNACMMDSDFDRQTAEKLARTIAKYTGAQPTCVKDTATDPTPYEIYVGRTNRMINNYEGKGAAIVPVVKTANEVQGYLLANGEKVDFYNMNAQVQNFEEYQKPDGIHLTVEGLALYAQK